MAAASGGSGVTDEEIEVVAEELAKAGGVSWYPGRTRGALLRPVSERYRDRARLAIAALDRLRAINGPSDLQEPALEALSASKEQSAEHPEDIRPGATVVYRPPGDQRAITCRVERVEEGRAYLVPAPRADVGWVSLDNLMPFKTETQAKDEK
jgi:hypothetical protein